LKIAVVGAGFAGLATAKILREFEHDVTVFDKAPDVGGVWSATRRYTGLRTQNNKDSYAFSDLPMPRDYPEWPTGEQVQAYLERYVAKFELRPHLRLATEVVRAELTDAEDGWMITARRIGAPVSAPEKFDHLVVANGIFSDPVFPQYEGYADLVRAGGKLVASSQLNTLDDARGKNVIVVGYGKSACDVAAEIGPVAKTTTVVARQLLWKMPKRLGKALNYKYLLLTRLGEALFHYQDLPSRMERFLHGPGDKVRGSMVESIGSLSTWQFKLKKLGLVPDGPFAKIARSNVSLSTDGFFEQIEDGTIKVHRDAEIKRFVTEDGKPLAELTDGTRLPAELVVCGTGFHQRIPFLDETITSRLVDDAGDYQLYRQILPHDVPNLTFAGYNSSLFSPLSAEAGALWIAAYLADAVHLPAIEERRKHVAERVAWMKERTEGRHARGTNVIPFSLHNVDETLDEIGVNIGRGALTLQWLLPVDPSAYKNAVPQLKAKLAEHAAKERIGS
jgi:cation diffusion facilitator CzcD-associated flavoprotein CzcO